MKYNILRKSIILLAFYAIVFTLRWFVVEKSIQPDSNCIWCVSGTIWLIYIVFVAMFYYVVNVIKLNELSRYVITIALLIIGYLVIEYLLLRTVHYLLVNNVFTWEETVSAIGLREIVERSNAIFFLSFISIETTQFLLACWRNRKFILTSSIVIVLICSVSLLVINTFNLFQYI